MFGKGTGANGLVPETKINKKLNKKTKIWDTCGVRYISCIEV